MAGELDAAHILYGLLYGLELGIASKPQAMANLMTLNRNGQAITLSSELQEKGVTDLGGLKRLIDRSAPGSYTFAHTFPTGTHAMWLYYWLASAGIDPFNDVAHRRGAAAADGDEHAHRQYERLLCRRAVERPRY